MSTREAEIGIVGAGPARARAAEHELGGGLFDRWRAAYRSARAA